FLPTVTTHSLATLSGALRTIGEACDQDRRIAARVPGIHLEGPYISVQDGPRGAHPQAHCHAPDWDEFCRLQEASGGRIRVLTLSPEHPGAAPFISRVAASGVVVSIGHTAATARQIDEAADAGATMSTHLGNGSHPLLPRHENYLWAQIADDRLTAGLIVDGHHLPRHLVKAIVRAKQPGRCVLVSDLSGYAGLPVGRYQTELCELEILATGKLVVAGQEELLAGASRPLCEGIGNVMDFAGIGLAAAVDMATRRPAELLGLEVAAPRTGSAADFVVFELAEGGAEGGARLDVKRTIGGGEVLWQAAS
ncbi:MAG: amidohydrolase family protein, partial [Planctomycetota bacterium]|nr:amidohydrolase family protein [Planctomycetota bacterium]